MIKLRDVLVAGIAVISTLAVVVVAAATAQEHLEV